MKECGDARTALAASAATRPDWVVLDLDRAGGVALTLARQISSAHPAIRLAVLADQDSPRLRLAARRAGACAYVLKEKLIDMRLLVSGGMDTGSRTVSG